MESIVLTINGQKVTCPAGSSILDAAIGNGIHIPTLCHHPQLKPYGACRICLVEDEKTRRLMASCVSPAAPDMVIATDSPRVLKHRRNIVRLMIAEHPESCIVCGKGNRCELRRIAAQLGVGEPDFYPMPNFKPFEQLNPFIIRDLSKCILCGKCIRADHELVATGAIDYSHRGFHSRPATLYETALEGSNCTFCGTCVSICPTGALSVKNAFFVGTPESESDSICGFCGAGCTLSLGTAGDRIVEVNPSRLDATVNGVTLCVRGHFAHDFIHSEDRLTQPMIRNSAGDVPADAEGQAPPSHVPATWEAAMGEIVEKLSTLRRQNGPGSLAFIGSTRCSNEENYLFQKIARVVFGSSNIVSGGHAVGQGLISKIEEKTYGLNRTCPLSDLENAEAILVVHADPDHLVPVADYHIKRAVKNGSPLVVIDARKTDLAAMASTWLRPAIRDGAGTDYRDIICCLAAHLLRENAVDKQFIGAHTEGFGEFRAYLEEVDIPRIAQNCNVKAESIQKAAGRLSGRKIAVVVGPDLLHLPGGRGVLDALFNLVLMTGGIHEKGSGFHVPVGECNLIGSMDMGVGPDLLPGRRHLQDDRHRAAVGGGWHATLSPDPGLDLIGFIEAVENGSVKAAYIMGENIVRFLPQSERVVTALKKLDFLVVQDVCFTRTAGMAHVILPGAVMAEKSGSFTNMEGRIQAFAPAISPPGQARADWEILADLARRMGYPEQYASIEKIRREIREVVPIYAEMGKQRQAWVKNNEADTPFSANSRKFKFDSMTPGPAIKADPAYPITAFLASPRHHIGAGTRTSRSRRIRSYDGKPLTVMISMADGRSMDLLNGGRIRIVSAHGAVEAEVETERALQAGQVMIPLAVQHNQAAALAGLTRPEKNDAFGWTVCRVNIEKI